VKKQKNYSEMRGSARLAKPNGQGSIKRFGLKESTIAAINGVIAHYPEIESAILYGSRAKGNYRNGSDIDLTLTDKNLTYDSMVRLEIEIDDLLLPYSFDISILRHIDNPDVVDHIHRVGIPFYIKQTAAEQPATQTS